MVKIITTNNRIIFEGHADTVQECETISLMCEQLKDSEAFKTIKYESGYAEFEKVGTTNDLKFEYVPNPTPDITDLTNTTWVLNTTLIDSLPIGVYYITGHTSSNNNFTSVERASLRAEYFCFNYNNVRTSAYNYDTSSWIHPEYKNITITGGTDVTNTTLIEWLQANATLQETPTTDTKPVYKRVNGEWVKQLAFERVSGAWVRISSKGEPETFLLTTSSDEILQDSNGNNLEFKEM